MNSQLSTGLLLTIGLGLSVLGCSDSGVVDVDGSDHAAVVSQSDASPSVAKSDEVHYVPYKETGRAPDPAPVAPEDLGMVCTASETESIGVGYITATHFGRVPAINHGCTDYSIGKGRIRTKIIARNGDYVLKQARCEVIDFVNIIYRCEIEVIGGSGRYENASTPPGEPIIKIGQFINPPTFDQEWHAEGRISFGVPEGPK